MMRIGILTFAYVPNFGANLQAFVTYNYLQANGYDPILLIWEPNDFASIHNEARLKGQTRTHYEFIETMFQCTYICRTEVEVARAVVDFKIESIIVGSDAVLQHHPLPSRVVFPTKRLFFVKPVTEERMFPNPFWGNFTKFLDFSVPMVMLSASSQNSAFQFVSRKERILMGEALMRFRIITVRDDWTQKMIRYLTKDKLVPRISPDPVFGFNDYCSSFVPKREELLKKYNLPNRYVLISFRTKNLISKEWIKSVENHFRMNGKTCVGLPMPGGFSFDLGLKQNINCPITPLEWYGLIKYSEGYIGENMHPIIVSLHNAVPFFSFDTYGNLSFGKLLCNSKSSKIYHILEDFNLLQYRVTANVRFYSPPKPQELLSKFISFNRERVRIESVRKQKEFSSLMRDLIGFLE